MNNFLDTFDMNLIFDKSFVPHQFDLVLIKFIWWVLSNLRTFHRLAFVFSEGLIIFILNLMLI